MLLHFFNLWDDLDKLVRFSTQHSSCTAQRWASQQGYFLQMSIFLIFDFYQSAEKVVISSFVGLVLVKAPWMHWDTHAPHQYSLWEESCTSQLSPEAPHCCVICLFFLTEITFGLLRWLVTCRYGQFVAQQWKRETLCWLNQPHYVHHSFF